ncbi:DUF6233 domain-containing protein [Streptomyces davaonensis]|uniref:DUF6233 domain-containing protein n=1 Tax=Streptomyces davaonensis TaxID=348043 RepID=UPI001E2D1CC7|nr:DUF6233 domain-containing protein [Streptomyces davaonensis]
MAGKRNRGATREQALRALAERGDPCPRCNPDFPPGIRRLTWVDAAPGRPDQPRSMPGPRPVALRSNTQTPPR